MSTDIRALWEKVLAAKTGREHWRSLARWLEADGSDGAAREEFTKSAMERPDEPSRRRFLELLGASIALAGASGCVKDRIEKILPFAKPPPEVTPGVARYYATSMSMHGYATGLLVRMQDGRPVKVEGNPAHPSSLGTTGVFEQASILDLYDPYRAGSVLESGQPRSWEALVAILSTPRTDRGAGLRILLEPTSSPLLASLLVRILDRYPAARISFHSSIDIGAAQEGASMVYGKPLQTHYDFMEASVIAALDADFLDAMPNRLRHSHDFAKRRRPSWPDPKMNRLYVVESAFSATGSVADHRIRRRPSEVGNFAAALAAEIVLGDGAPGGIASEETIAAFKPFYGREERSIVVPIARDLRRAGRNGVVVVGPSQPAHVHALAALANSALGNMGAATFATAPVNVDMGGAQQRFADLVREMHEGMVDSLVIVEGNPVYSSAADVAFARALGRVRLSIYLGMHVDETAGLCTWFVPNTHYMEAWGDGRAYDGTASIVQPLIQPMFGGRSAAELLAALLGDGRANGYDLVRELWRRRFGEAEFEQQWDVALRRGVIAGTDAPRVEASFVAGAARRAIDALSSMDQHSPQGTYEVSFKPSNTVFDGRFAGNPWLQELPEPMTTLTWGNAAVMSVRTARDLEVENGDMVELSRARPEVFTTPDDTTPNPVVTAAALVLPGHADGAITLRMGYGRTAGNPVAIGVGVDVSPIRSHGRSTVTGVVARRTGAKSELSLTQKHWEMHGRPLVLTATLREYENQPEFTREQRGRVLSIMPNVAREGDQWAMTIDTSICTGCSACVVACQAENNIPVVGKEGVHRSREMHWLRIDTYYAGNSEEPQATHQPMMCQHCEAAPCEYVCPVNATVHSPDGLNEMVYNRCIGTRFCSNNCPYKVRRFNWFDWLEEKPALNGNIRRLQKNTDVTVRERGVMEKCTFCVQRIRRAEIDASIERRNIRPDEVITACAAACPTRAIQFGSLAHKDTTMVKWRDEPRAYSVLNELGTRPRVQYLATIKNPNPEMA